MLSYAIKRISRSWKLFAALALGMTLAATFFGGLNVAADTVGKQALDAQLVNTPVDVNLYTGYSGIGGFYSGSAYPASAYRNVTNAVRTIDDVSAAESMVTAYNLNGSYPSLKAIQDSSVIFSHMTLVGGRKTLYANETLINADSSQAADYPIGRAVYYSMNSYSNGSRQITYNVTLTVVGLVSLDTVAQRTLGIGYYYPPCLPPGPCIYNPTTVQKQQSVLIVSWEQTLAPIVDWIYNRYQEQSVKSYYPFSQINPSVNVYLDRDRLISPFGVENSISQIQQVEARISRAAQEYGFHLQDNLLSQLTGFSQEIFALRLQYSIVSIPVFFLAWFVGRTVSQSSYNLRRKEIGLLLTRGFTKRQLFNQFLTEGLLIGIVAGLAGVLLAYALNPTIIWALGGGTQASTFLTSDTVMTTLVFAIILTLVSIFSPARQASDMDPAQALKQYVYLEETRPRRKRWAIVAFSLGLYQLVLLFLGINYQNIGRYIFGSNFFLAIILIVAAILSFALSYVGPFLFLYGAAQLSTGLAHGFHRRFAALARRIIGDVSVLASRSVFRNPRRVAALVFIVALIVGYSIWVIGDLASQQDYNYRQAEIQNGSDLRLSGINSVANATRIASELDGWSNITGATPEVDLSASSPFGTLPTIKAIDPTTWRNGAYYEPSWFSGDINSVFSRMELENQTIVLDQGVASYYSIEIGTRFTMSYIYTSGTGSTFGRANVTVIGYFGPDYSRSSGPFGYFQTEGWSFIPLQLLNHNIARINATSLVLAKAATGVSQTQIAQSIQTYYPSLSVSAAQVTLGGVGGIISAGGQNVLRLGTAFAGLASSIGVGTVVYTGYREREKEITMVAVRGLSYKQLLGLLVTEFLPLIIFSLIIGTIVGLTVVWGDAQGQNSLSQGYFAILAARRIIFPEWALLNIFAIIGLLIGGVFLPAIFAARKDLSKMNRTVRFA
ncbi:MAG TPA: FtsX-like permease family protein [Candidatus Dormibacteraeota bacterium]|jgi:ABC-type antimicrobial peptide transport system permease subunit|nr:FtsX-like permease family protein [Candidatus Dormibacteraeota bacterium]